MADRKDKICVDQDRLIEDVQTFAGQTRIMSVAAKGLARPLLEQAQGARRFDALRAEARYGKSSDKARKRREKADAATALRQDFERALVADLAEAPEPGEKQSGLYGTVTRAGAPQPDLLVGMVTDKGTWRGYGCTDRHGAYSFTFAAGAKGALRVQEKSGAPLYQATEALPRLAAGQSLRRDIELDASGPICPEPGPIDDGGDDEPQPVTVEVPDLVGRTEEEAIQVLRDARLNRGSRTQTPSDEEEGTVIDQAPNAASQVEPGAAVDIVVAEARQQLMPKVTDIPLSLAHATLKRAGLSRIEEEEKDAPDAVGLVLEQDPQAGVPVTSDTAVTLVVGRGPELIMPRLIGKKADAARDTLREMGLRDIKTEERPDPDRAGLVLDQRPGAGSAVSASTTAVLVVGSQERRPEAEIEPRKVLEIMAEDPAMRRRNMSPDRVAAVLEPAGQLSGDLLVALSKLTIPKFAERLRLDNRTMASEILRALRGALRRD